MWRAAGAPRGAAGSTWHSLKRLLTEWRRGGSVATLAPVAQDDRTPIEHALAQHLHDERGLTPATQTAVLRVVRQFLVACFGRAPVRVGALAATDVTGFVQRQMQGRSPGYAGTVVSALRSFFRFLVLRGEVPAALATCIPAVARWRDATVPIALAPAEVARLLRTCDRGTARGRRDYAILLLLARLGLRAGEVAALRLEDCDWRSGTITVRGKGRREARLPLPRDVGVALSAYLRSGRPRCTSRHVFVSAHAPHQGISRVTVGMRVNARGRGSGARPCAPWGPPAPPHAGDRSAAPGRLARRHWRSLAPSARRYDGDLRESRSRGAPGARAALAGSRPMTALSQALDDYLALRRALGFALRPHERELRHFVAFLAHTDTATITTHAAVLWATQPAHAQPVRWAARLSMVRGFAAYRQAADPQTEIPPSDALPRRAQRRTPHLYTADEVARLLTAAARLHGAHGGPAAPYPIVLGLLAATGLRANEALALDRTDVDLHAGVLRIRRTKFGKTRLVPLHLTTTDALRRYADARDRHPAGACTTRFFVNAREHTPLTYRDLWLTFRRLAYALGLRSRTGRCGPRLHDFRHTFAVRTLVGWYRAGLDVEAQLPRLSTYLGHTHVTYTYWYLSASPELLGLAGARLDAALGALP